MKRANITRELAKEIAWILALSYGVYDFFFSGKPYGVIMAIPGTMMLNGLVGAVAGMRKARTATAENHQSTSPLPAC